MKISIWCCGCSADVSARLTTGHEIYPSHSTLKWKPFWKCDACGNYVGTHFKTPDVTKPLGNIPTPELRDARKKIHAMIDPVWKGGKISREDIYARISKHIGKEYHTAELANLEDARVAYRVIKAIIATL